jgi:hypothetical protein
MSSTNYVGDRYQKVNGICDMDTMETSMADYADKTAFIVPG